MLITLAVSGCSGESPKKQTPMADPPSSTIKEQKQEIPPPPAPLESPASNGVVLIIVDTLRADRLGCYGHKGELPITPAMDGLAAEGIVFERFHAASPWTGASFGSILTGVPPTVHGGGKRLHGKGNEKDKILGIRVTGLSKEVPTLPEMLTGVASGAIVTNSFIHPSLGFGRGFDHYDHENAHLSRSRRATATTAAALKWLSQVDVTQPFFLMVHYFDPHISYDPPQPYLKQFAKGPRGRIRVPFADHDAARKGTLNPTQQEKAFIRGLYNGEVRFVDDQIKILLDAMKAQGLLDASWILLTSDHGEEQFDHNSFDHGHRYEEEVTRVPLIIRAPKGQWHAGKRIPYSARHIDIAPTVLEIFNIPVPGDILGKSLIPLITGQETSHRPAYMEFNIYWTRRDALFDGRYKIIHDTEGDYGWFYDLAEDPAEKEKLKKGNLKFEVLKRQLLAVRKQMAAQAKAVGKAEAVQLDPEAEAALRSLGYID
ncbi:MAG: sulfatase [Myxococcota bacterium]|nr:sulfatase [Myxococcota bacterium]